MTKPTPAEEAVLKAAAGPSRNRSKRRTWRTDNIPIEKGENAGLTTLKRDGDLLRNWGSMGRRTP